MTPDEVAAAALDAEADWQDDYIGTALLVMARLGGLDGLQARDSWQQTIGTVNHARETVDRLRARAAELRGQT